MCYQMAFQERDVRAEVNGDRGPGISERKLGAAVARREARLATAACILSRWKGDLASLEGEVSTMCSSVGGRVEAGGLRVLEVRIQGC